MGVNAVIDNVATQQMAVAASQSATAELRELEQKELWDPGREKVERESEVSRLLQEGTSPSKAGMNVLLGLASKLATLGVNLKPERFSGKAQDALEEEFNRMLGGKENFEDLVDLRSLVGRVAEQKNQQNQQQKEQAKEGRLLLDREVQASVREYASLYAQYTVSHSPEIKKKLEKLELELREKGLTNKDFISIKTAATNSIRQELAQQIKDAFLKKVLSPEKSVEMVINEKSLNDLLDFALLKGVHDHQSLQATANDILKEAREEIKDFAQQKIEEGLIRKHLTENPKELKNLDQQLKSLLGLAAKAGLNLEEFVNNWRIKQFDLGMFIADIPLGQGQAGTNPDGQGQQPKPYEFTREDEKDLLANRLRALHMHRALTGDWKTMLETQFKMRKLKNGLIKLGVTSEELMKIEKEGRAAARLRLLEMLKGVLEERATLYELAGPACKLIEQKIKGMVSNLERLGQKLSEVEFYSLRDAANLKVFNAARQEFLTLKDMLSTGSNPMIEKRCKLVLKLLKRLKEESQLPLEIPEEDPVAKVKEAV